MNDEKLSTTTQKDNSVSSVLDAEQSKPATSLEKVTLFLKRYGIETTGIDPIPVESRTDTRLFQMFFVWFSCNMNILGLGTGAAGPAFFGLGLNQSLITLTIVDLITCAFPAYFAVFGPKTGMRSMVQARYSWGYYGSIIPSALNVFTMQGFLILNCIIGGQTLASVSSHLNDTLGIVIISVISLIISSCGYGVIHWFESIVWIPNVVALAIMLGVGGKHLVAVPPSSPVAASSIVTFAMTTTSAVVSWCTMSSDYGVYHDSTASTKRVFLYTYLGFFASNLPAHLIGATFAASAPHTPAWSASFDGGNNVGGLVGAVLEPLGAFGKILTVLLALSVPSVCAPTMYTFASSFMTITPLFARVPRYVYAFVSEGILIPVAIIGATHFYSTFVDILSLIGYWSAVFTVVILVEHLIFRRNDFRTYDLAHFDQPRLLPPGLASVMAFCCAVGITVPCMSQAWYTGPIARLGTGDLGIPAGAAVALVVYIPARAVERSVWQR